MSRKQRAIDAAGSLIQATEELNSDLLDFEQTLEDLAMGVTAAVPLDTHHVLRFGKCGNNWRLTVENDQGGSERVLNVSRELRVLAASVAGNLYAALVECAEEQSKNIHMVSSHLKAFTVSIRKPK